MDTYEEIYLISNLIANADTKGNVNFSNPDIWKSLFLHEGTKVHEDYFLELNEKEILCYEEVGEEGFTPIVVCSIKNKTKEYLKSLIISQKESNQNAINEIKNLNQRISEILTFNPNKLSTTINKSQLDIKMLKRQISENPLLIALTPQLDEIEKNLNSVNKVAEDYEEVYKNIILPVKQEGEAGVKQTVKWAIIGILISSIISGIISWLMK